MSNFFRYGLDAGPHVAIKFREEHDLLRPYSVRIYFWPLEKVFLADHDGYLECSDPWDDFVEVSSSFLVFDELDGLAVRVPLLGHLVEQGLPPCALLDCVRKLLGVLNVLVLLMSRVPFVLATSLAYF